MPGFFRFMTLLCFRIFESEQVEAAILGRAGVSTGWVSWCSAEVGLGGRMDATNVVPSPVVCGISSLSLEHTSVLGNTLALIAAEKAGIIKHTVQAFSVPQKVASNQLECTYSPSRHIEFD